MSDEDPFPFEVPDDAQQARHSIAELVDVVNLLRSGAVELAHRHQALADTVDELAGDHSTDHTALRELAADHTALRDHVQKTEKQRGNVPKSVRWDVLDRDAAQAAWTWLITRVQWLVERYGLQEDLGECWPQHPALVEELTALCWAWHAAYDGGTGEAPLRWHEALDRARRRWHAWDRHTKCRLGQHNDPHTAADWSPAWRARAGEVARRDVSARPQTAGRDNRKQVRA